MFLWPSPSMLRVRKSAARVRNIMMVRLEVPVDCRLEAILAGDIGVSFFTLPSPVAVQEEPAETSGEIIVVNPLSELGSEPLRIHPAENGALEGRSLEKRAGQPFAERRVDQHPTLGERLLHTIGGKLIDKSAELEIGDVAVSAAQELGLSRRTRLPQSDESHIREFPGQLKKDFRSLPPIPPADKADGRVLSLLHRNAGRAHWRREETGGWGPAILPLRDGPGELIRTEHRIRRADGPRHQRIVFIGERQQGAETPIPDPRSKLDKPVCRHSGIAAGHEMRAPRRRLHRQPGSE